MRIVLCDNCGERCHTVVIGGDEGDYCSLKCAIAAVGASDACAHEDNIDGTTHDTGGRRLICRACGYDRVEAVEELKV